MTLNPVTLKELRQLMRTRLIWLMLAGYPVLLFIAFVFAVTAARHEADVGSDILGDSFGKPPFTIVAMATGATVGFILPLVASIKATFEHVKGRMGMEFTTALTPAQLVNGKLMATGAIAAVLVAVSMPFFALTYLMRGVQLASVFTMPMLLLLFCLIQTAIGLAIATLNTLNVPMRIFGLVGMITAMGGTFMAFLEDCANLYFDFTPSGIASFSLIAFSALVFFPRMAAAHASPPFADSERALRNATAALLVLTLPIPFLNGWELWTAGWGMIALLLMGRSCLLFRPMPRNARIHAPRSFLGRLASFPFTTGTYTGPLFAIIMLALILLPGLFLCDNRDLTILAIFLGEAMAMVLVGIGCLPLFRSPLAPTIFMAGVVFWIFFANFSVLLLRMGAISEELSYLMACNLDGIDRHPIWHLLIIGTVSVFDTLMFFPNLIHEFRSYRRP